MKRPTYQTAEKADAPKGVRFGNKVVTFMDYSIGEELVSAISHGLGTLLSIAALVLMIVKEAFAANAQSIVTCCVFGTTLIILYLDSTLYHSLKKNKAKAVFRVLDHCSVFLLIAGTYTPFTLIALKGALGWTLFGIIWGIAIIGIVFNAIDVDKYEKLSMYCNIAMGWAIVFAFGPLIKAMSFGGIVLLIAGGVAYSAGAILYANAEKKRYMHSVWHFFVLAGSILHFFSIYLYIL